MLIRFKIASVLERPLRLTNGKGTMKPTTRARRYRFGSISQAAMSFGLPLVSVQKRKRENTRGMVRKVAMR
jgi:hypothetical protein